MNSFAFCGWFNDRTPIDLDFARAYADKAMALDEKADADVVPVPEHSTVEGGKSAAVVALQLLKRNRNIRYAKRSGRMPPSVMMARFSGDAAVPGSSISGALDAIVGVALATLEAADKRGEIADVRNPMCSDDRFTDRWPENLAAQRTYIQDLKLFRNQLADLMSDHLTLDQKRALLVEMFGEGPAQLVVEDYAASLGQAIQSGQRIISGSGRVIPVTAPAIVSASPTQARPHTFYGSRWRKD